MDKRRTTPKSDRFFIAFSTIILVLITIDVATDAVFGEMMWIVNADYPGGADAYLAEYASVWYETLGTGSCVVLNLFGDALMIYRCMVLWSDIRVIIFPCFLWVATLGLGIFQLYLDGSPNGDFFAGVAAQIGVAYYTTTIALNFIATCLICGRIIYVAHWTKKTLGREIATTYTSAASIIIESALPYTLSGIAFLVAYGLNNGTSILWGNFYSMFTCISPQMIIYRVASGRAWTRNKSSEYMTTMAFPDRSRGMTTSNGTESTAINLRSMGSAMRSDSKIEAYA